MKKLILILPLAFVLYVMVGCQDKDAMAELEEFRAQEEVEKQNKEIVRRYVEEEDKGNLLEIYSEYDMTEADNKTIVTDTVADSDGIDDMTDIEVLRLKDKWKGLRPGQEFSYFFLDSFIDGFYRAEQRMDKVIQYFTLIAIFISCL